MSSPDDPKKFPWRVLTDEAVETSADDYFQIHSAYARLLLRITQTCTTPFSIGLYSSWGSGKTSVAKILRGLVIQDKPQALGFVYLDVWKYSSDPLKRWILFETERQLEDQEILRQSTFEGRGLQSHLEFEEKWEEKGPLQVSLATINFLGKVLAFSAVFSVPTYFALALLAPLGSRLLRWLLSLSGLVSTVSAVGLLLQFTVKKIPEAFEGVVFTRTTRHVASKPAFSAEKFGGSFMTSPREPRKSYQEEKSFSYSTTSIDAPRRSLSKSLQFSRHTLMNQAAFMSYRVTRRHSQSTFPGHTRACRMHPRTQQSTRMNS